MSLGSIGGDLAGESWATNHELSWTGWTAFVAMPNAIHNRLAVAFMLDVDRTGGGVFGMLSSLEFDAESAIGAFSKSLGAGNGGHR